MVVMMECSQNAQHPLSVDLIESRRNDCLFCCRHSSLQLNPNHGDNRGRAAQVFKTYRYAEDHEAFCYWVVIADCMLKDSTLRCEARHSSGIP